jgi:hypothetical protein
MLGDNSTHPMVMFPKAYDERVTEWITKVKEALRVAGQPGCDKTFLARQVKTYSVVFEDISFELSELVSAAMMPGQNMLSLDDVVEFVKTCQGAFCVFFG